MFVRLVVAGLIVLVFWAILARPSESAGPERAYVVRPGDTLWTVASSHYAGDPRRAVWRIRERNGLQHGALRVGQRLVLPRA